MGRESFEIEKKMSAREQTTTVLYIAAPSKFPL